MIRSIALAVVVVFSILGTEHLKADEKKKEDAPPKRRAIQLQIRRGAVQIAPARRRVSTAGILGLLQRQEVQKELKLDEDQIAKVSEAAQELNKHRRDTAAEFRGLQGEERRKKASEIREKITKKTEEVNKKVRDALKPEQSQRLEQIALQVQGMRALRTKEIIKQLKITKEQQAKIDEVQSSIAGKRQKVFQDVRNGNIERTKVRDKLQELVKQTDEETLKVLTEAQRTQFDKMKGKKFELQRRPINIRAVPALPIQPRKVKPKSGDT
jgi:hypothetical protein